MNNLRIKGRMHDAWSPSNDLACKVRSIFMKNKKWSSYCIQLSLPYYDDQDSKLDKIFKLKVHFFLVDLYSLIFIEGYNYHHVFLAVNETLSDLKMVNDFKDCLIDPVAMMYKSIDAHHKQNENNDFSLKNLQLLIFN